MTPEDALKKIKKCLALGRSANEHEAAAALRQAQKLMEQFNLREQDISLADVAEVKVRAYSAAGNTWELRLVGMVARAFGCETFRSVVSGYNSAGNWTRSAQWVFVGIENAPTIAGYAFEVLLRQCARARLAHISKQPKRCKPITKTSRGDAFAIGWVAAVADKVQAFAQPSTDKTLLLTYMERNHGDLESIKPRNTTESRKVDGHLAAGWREGRNAELHAGVGSAPAQGLLA